MEKRDLDQALERSVSLEFEGEPAYSFSCNCEYSVRRRKAERNDYLKANLPREVIMIYGWNR